MNIPSNDGTSKMNLGPSYSTVESALQAMARCSHQWTPGWVTDTGSYFSCSRCGLRACEEQYPQTGPLVKYNFCIEGRIDGRGVDVNHPSTTNSSIVRVE